MQTYLYLFIGLVIMSVSANAQSNIYPITPEEGKVLFASDSGALPDFQWSIATENVDTTLTYILRIYKMEVYQTPSAALNNVLYSKVINLRSGSLKYQANLPTLLPGNWYVWQVEMVERGNLPNVSSTTISAPISFKVQRYPSSVFCKLDFSQLIDTVVYTVEANDTLLITPPMNSNIPLDSASFSLKYAVEDTVALLTSNVISYENKTLIPFRDQVEMGRLNWEERYIIEVTCRDNQKYYCNVKFTQEKRLTN